MNTKLLQPLDLTQTVSTKTALSDLDLTLTLAKQIVLKSEQKFPMKTQFLQINYGQFSVLNQLWEVAEKRDPEISWPIFIETLQNLVKQALNHVVTLTLAYEPTLAQTEDLATLVRQELSESAILDIKYQPDIIAGCIVASNGKQLNYSLATWLPSYLEANSKDRTI